MMSQTIPRIITVPRSGMSKKIKNNIALTTMNEIKNFLSLTILRLLNNHDHKKNTYHNLNNSAGWILGNKGIFTQPLAPLSVTPSPGINTANWSTIRIIAMIVIFLSFWKNLIETLYISPAATTAIPTLLSCLKK